MRRRFLQSAILPALFSALFSSLLLSDVTRAGTLQVLPIAGRAYGVDGNNVVGATAISHLGFLYDGSTYSPISPPGATGSTAYGIAGNRIVGVYDDASFNPHGFLYDGVSYTTLDHPLGAQGTFPHSLFGHTVVGSYIDAAAKAHGFAYDGSSWTTIDDPLGVKGTTVAGISGNKIVGTYIDAKNRTHGFLYNGSTYTTLDDPSVSGATNSFTSPNGIWSNTVVGQAFNGLSGFGFVYDGSTFTHPFGTSSNLPGVNSLSFSFTGISGNTIVGYYRDFPSGIDHPIIYTIPEPGSLLLAASAAVGAALAAARRAKARRDGQHRAYVRIARRRECNVYPALRCAGSRLRSGLG